MKTILHVHQQHIRANLRDGGNRAPLIVRTYKGVQHAHEVKIDGPCMLIYSEKPAACGARAYIQTESNVEIVR